MMKPFDPNAKCPKCGHDNIKTAYYENDEHRWHGYNKLDRERSEHLRRTCERCRYQWNELPIGVSDETE